MNQWMQAQYKNAFMWVPFIMALGAAAYFGASNATCIFGAAVAGTLAVGGIIIHNKYATRAGVLFLFGLLYAMAYTYIIATPRIYYPMRGAQIEGRVEQIDYTPDKTRLFISVPATQLKSHSHKNAIIRLNIDEDATSIAIGDNVRATASLFPPATSYAPETFDYARWAYFNGLSATGFITDYKILAHGDSGGFGVLRNHLHKHAQSFLADALVLGYKNAIPRDEAAIWTAAGIGHVWSISGFHMTLVSGWLFALFFCIFRLTPYITRRIPARIPALCCAWVGLLIYLMISGMNVATIRAFLMATLVFAAFIIGRNALSMRNICIAFCIIFLINPYHIMQPGFQLSFSAIFGLVWFWSGRHCIRTSRPGKIAYAIYAAAMTSVIATLFTAPFVITHFYLMPTYGLIGNLLLLPIFSFAIMPIVVVGIITSMVGWNWPLGIAEVLYEKTLILARAISDIPYANIITPHIPNIAMVVIIIGFLCIMFIQRTDFGHRINYAIGAALICAGIIITVTSPRPVFYAAPEHALVAFSYDDGLEFSKAKSSGHMFAFETWKQLNRQSPEAPNKRRAANHGVWLYETNEFKLAYIQQFVPLAREINALCRDASIDYIVSYFDIRAPKCEHKILRGGFVIYPNGRVRMNSATRPWNSPHP